LSDYVFITPNVCNDMHDDAKCPTPKPHHITAGDNWLSKELPRIIDWATKNAGVIFIRVVPQ